MNKQDKDFEKGKKPIKSDDDLDQDRKTTQDENVGRKPGEMDAPKIPDEAKPNFE